MAAFNELAFLLHEMLGLPESVGLAVERISGPATALTLRVTVLGWGKTKASAAEHYHALRCEQLMI